MKMENFVETKKDWFVKATPKKKVLTMVKPFALVARLGVRTLLAYATHRGFKVYQMDVKSTILNGIHDEEV